MSAQQDEGFDQPSQQQPLAEHDRLALPVDAEEPPRLEFPVVGIGASAGGLEAFIDFFKALRPDSGAAFVLIQHLPPDRDSMIAEILSRHTRMPVHEIVDGMVVEPNNVYIIRPNYTLTIHKGALRLGPRPDQRRHVHPVDDFFKSLAEEQRERAICIVMSGMGSNGSAGAQAIKAAGGLCIAQDPESAMFPSMPRHVIDVGYSDYILRPQDMPEVLLSYIGHPYASGSRETPSRLGTTDQQYLREILAVLRTRTRQDFSGYKKPTVFRRVQRRMGLNRVESLRDYAKLLRQSPSEVGGLADDLLIHVTGFFRDPEAWETLRERVIMPLIATREQGSAIRCWVTACSSGEEAYTLAILLREEADRVNKRFDIKVFATDMADRTLHHARQGVYPGGIELDVSPERLERSFVRDPEVFRVRPEIREMVVFAPQNILQDPPFSRLDIVTCRNLLIYLEPNVQHRVLSMLHFGLREGETLLLGTSETVAGAEDLFEPIDKKARIFRRVGPTRYGAIDFPLPHTVPAAAVEPRLRPTVAQLTARALLDRHTPAAVTVDRESRVVYFHGKTDAFLTLPRGDATRDLLAMARDGVRGAIRAALQQAAATQDTAIVEDGWIEAEPGLHAPVTVTAAPLESKNAADYFLVSFEQREQLAKVSQAVAEQIPLTTDSSEVRRIRDELQSTIEELQTSNEELKASHEEVVSMNEELQSTNEELETSREEMQSLNEELTTVNAQLIAKMDEHQTARNDLSSLLSSTDIAVLFLDTQLRIRQYTPMLKELLELISSDVGRPLSDLAQKFEDPNLIEETKIVLERLIPSEREVAANHGRWWLRRITPYRTSDNHIDGVVIAFIDITQRRRIEEALRASRVELEAELAATQQLNSAATALAAADSEGVIFEEVLNSVIEMQGADMADVRLFDRATQTLTVAASRRLDGAYLGDFKSVGMGGSWPYSRALRTGDTVVVENIGEDPQYSQSAEVAKAAGITGVCSIPLLDRDRRPLGVVSTYFREGHRPSQRQLRFSELHAHYTTEVMGRMRAEHAVKTTDALLRGFFNNAAVGMCQAELATGQLVHVNKAACDITGFSEEELLKLTLLDVAHPDERSSVWSDFSAAIRGETPYYAVDTRLVRKDGEVVWIRVNVGVMRDVQGAAWRAIVMLEDISDRRQYEESLHDLNLSLETRMHDQTVELAGSFEARAIESQERAKVEAVRVELLRRLVTVQEDERRRIARELHDEMGQLLAALIMEIRSVDSAQLSDTARGKLKQAQALANQIGSEVHDLALQLRPTALDDLGLQAALQQFTDTWSTRSGIGVDLHISDLDERFSATIETALYRVVQEALTNVVKHAMATRVSVILERKGNSAVAIIEDNGRGFDYGSLIKSGKIHERLGLLGMRERLATVGGTLEVESRQGQGTTIFAKAPLETD